MAGTLTPRPSNRLDWAEVGKTGKNVAFRGQPVSPAKCPGEAIRLPVGRAPYDHCVCRPGRVRAEAPWRTWWSPAVPASSGSRLARELLAAGSLEVAGSGARPLSRLTLIDRAPAPADLAADERVTAIRGDLGDLLDPARAGPGTLAGADVIFHLAAAVSGECEADFDLGMRANLRATESLLASCRALGTNPVVVFSSSLAVFGALRLSTRSRRSWTITPCRTRSPATACRRSSGSSCWPTTPARDSCAGGPSA